jgi:hypothetical protein
MPVALIFHNDATTLIHNATAWNRKKKGHKKPKPSKKKRPQETHNTSAYVTWICM